MKKTPLDKIIDIIREEMMTTGSTTGKPGFSSKGCQRANSRIRPSDGKGKKKKKIIGLGKGSRKRWMKK